MIYLFISEPQLNLRILQEGETGHHWLLFGLEDYSVLVKVMMNVGHGRLHHSETIVYLQIIRHGPDIFG